MNAVKQEVTRKHLKDKWCLEDIVLHTEITEDDSIDVVRNAPKEGVYIHGLHMEGAMWSKSKSSVVECMPNVLYTPMPLIHVTATTSSARKAKMMEDYGSNGPFECAVYKFPCRTDRCYIFTVLLPSHEKVASTWVLRGVAMLCNIDT